MIGPLLALRSRLDALHDRVLTEPAVVAQECRLQTTPAPAIEQLRFITAGVLPPLLARHGLVAALQTYACQSARHPVIHAQDGIERTRFGTSAEAAADVFSIGSVESLQSGFTDSHLGHPRVAAHFRDRDSVGQPLVHRVTGVAARAGPVQAIGGHLAPVDPPSGRLVGRPSVDACPTAGEFTVEAVLPAETAAETSSRRSGPNSDFSK